jgi:hypothetical protein
VTVRERSGPHSAPVSGFVISRVIVIPLVR